MNNHQTKFENYTRALVKLREGILKCDENDDLDRDGLIQRFEFTFELAWKTLQAMFENEGLIGLNSPKTVLKEALKAGLIDDEEIWLKMLTDRNSTAHIYNERMAIEICNRIRQAHEMPLEQLAVRIEKRIK
ncbi:MAG TPA: nucleotidyltransferase [Firmicutes bacterium]|jgi:nucleotidyltransferase substrate binding protein (TIGR01987 family)|nr:nucleotidyltransferase [Bacillota bacterium]